jgi:hypothetical protein
MNSKAKQRVKSRAKSKVQRENESTPGRANRRFALIERRHSDRKLVEFPRMKGRTVGKIALFTSSGYHSVRIDFQDKTSLNIAIEPDFTFKANYADLTTGNERRIRNWPAIRSQSL